MKRRLVVSLDGLAKDDLSTLSDLMDYPKQLHNCFALESANGAPFASVQSIWSEVLTGRDWLEVGCPGYSRPTSSLNTCEVMTEDELLYPADLALSDSAASLVINMPLLKPDRPNRFWLSDGSLPIQSRVSPERLALEVPFNKYQANPFPSTAHALIDLSESVQACLENEKQRLRCALELMKNTSWQSCFIRITAFDRLAHLLGADYLSCRQRLIWPAIKLFLSELDQMLSDINEIGKDSTQCVISTFGHVECRARVNLNQVLSNGGFCERRELHNLERAGLASRMRAVQELNSSAHMGCYPLVSLTKPFDLARTSAASPVYGNVYLNRQSRFNEGIVADAHAQSLTGQVSDYLNRLLARELGEGTYVFSSQAAHSDNRKGEEALRNSAPEIVVSAKGIDFHDANNIIAIDQENHPRSTHHYNGFVWLPDAKTFGDHHLKTTAIHRHFMEQSF